MAIFGIENGILVQQVNCQDVMGAGLAKAIMEKYPIVADEYHKMFAQYSKGYLFGKVQAVSVEDDLIICNLFTQYQYGNAAKNNTVYTDIPKLVDAISHVADKYPDKPVYIPYKIGCGYAGANWNEVISRIQMLHLSNIIIWDTRLQKEVLQTANEINQMPDNDMEKEE